MAQGVDCHDPRWSPDGSRIVFCSNADGDFEIFTVSRNGNNLKQWTQNQYYDSNPSYSPDGKTILFQSERGGISEFYSIELTDGYIHKIASIDGVKGASEYSPDGEFIVFECQKNDINDIYIMDRYGGNIRNLTNSTFNDFRPTWSIDGKSIFYYSNKEGNYALYSMDLNRTESRRILFLSGHQVDPSPMKNEINLLFVLDTMSRQDLCMLDLNTGQHEVVIRDVNDIMLPSSSPADKEIVFVTSQSGNAHISILNTNSKEIRRLNIFNHR